MATIKKPTKAVVKLETNKEYDKIVKALKAGANVVKIEYWNKTEYGVEYPTGGYFKISKPHYNKITKEYKV
jgi:hypothetical protein